MTATDAALVARIRAGDREAFADLYRQTYDTVYTYVLRRVHNLATAEDLTHDAFVRALTGIHSFAWRGTPVAAWLTTIARNICIDYSRRAEHRMTAQAAIDTLAEDLSPRLADDTDIAADTTHQVTLQQTALVLSAAIADLTPQQQQVLHLRVWQDMTGAQTAHALGTNTAAVKAMQHRAVTALRANPAVQALAVTR